MTKRADLYLFDCGYVSSRQSAKALIEKGSVTIDGKIVKKPSEQVSEELEHKVEIVKEKYVCRGGLKLEAALESFDISVGGFTCIDIGASTGGFTDCLLQHGAKKIYAVDSGHGQMNKELSLRDDVVSIEGYNARNLSVNDFPEKFNLAVMDVSFISQTYILPNITALLTTNGALVSLIKPQFEAGRSAVGKNGIVKSVKDRRNAILRVLLCAKESGFVCVGLCTSPILGGDGNTEFLAYFLLKNGENEKNEISDTDIDVALYGAQKT